MKVNTDGAANGCHGLVGGEEVFRTFSGFVKGCLAINNDIATAFEFYLLAVMFAIEKANEYALVSIVVKM